MKSVMPAALTTVLIRNALCIFELNQECGQEGAGVLRLFSI